MQESNWTRRTAALFLTVLFGLTALFLLLPDQSRSLTERRELTQFPKITLQSLGNGKAMRDFSRYVSDQFPLREEFRALKERLVFSLYGQRDNNGIYFAEDSVGELDTALNTDSVERFTRRMQEIRAMYLDGKNVYFALVPDKNAYLAERNGYPTLDYAAMQALLQSGLSPDFQIIDLFDTLDADSYYATDLHWRAEKLQSVAEKLGNAMGFSQTLPKELRTMPQPFYGVYASRTARPLPPDTIYYPVAPAIEHAQVTDLDRNMHGGIYWGEGDERDRYTFFLNGSTSLITIENPENPDAPQLVLFRDSFGSAIAPWLVEAYSKITLVDVRYMAPELLGRFVDFSDCEALFLYSVPVVNHSETIK